MAAFMASCNVRKVTTGFDGAFGIASRSLHEEFWPIAAAYAIEMILGGGYQISDGFRQLADHWFADIEGLGDDTKPWVIEQIDKGWVGSGRESPTARASRLGPNYTPLLRPKRIRDIAESMEQAFPKRLNPPNRTL